MEFIIRVYHMIYSNRRSSAWQEPEFEYHPYRFQNQSFSRKRSQSFDLFHSSIHKSDGFDNDVHARIRAVRAVNNVVCNRRIPLKPKGADIQEAWSWVVLIEYELFRAANVGQYGLDSILRSFTSWRWKCWYKCVAVAPGVKI